MSLGISFHFSLDPFYNLILLSNFLFLTCCNLKLYAVVTVLSFPYCAFKLTFLLPVTGLQLIREMVILGGGCLILQPRALDKCLLTMNSQLPGKFDYKKNNVKVQMSWCLEKSNESLYYLARRSLSYLENKAVGIKCQVCAAGVAIKWPT